MKKLDNLQEEIEINTPYITLGQLIKLANIFESGGMIKTYLSDKGVLVNNELERRRGRKLYPSDVITVENIGSYVVIGKVESK